MNRYYEVIAKCGHVGRGKYIEMPFYVRAENGRDAAAIVRAFPRVKRDHRMAISNVTLISAADYMEGRNKNNCNPYFLAKSVQDQRALCTDLSIISGDWQKQKESPKISRAEKKLPLKLKDPWKYHKYHGFEEATV